MILESKGYSYQDLTIVPAELSDINSRSEVKPYYENEIINEETLKSLGFTYKYPTETKYLLPIFGAPMGAVCDDSNYDYFLSQGIRCVIPTTVDISARINDLIQGRWVAFSINEVREHIQHNLNNLNAIKHCPTLHICIDCANGHMKSLLTLCKMLKETARLVGDCKIEIMTGNIANPDTIEEYCKAGIDYVRVGIGGGSECITATQTGVFYPLASLVSECAYYVDFYNSKYNTNLKVIADGGIKNYNDVCKALALGANYVMIGGLFMQCLEASAEVYKYNGFAGTYEKTDDIDSIKRGCDEKKKRELLPSLIEMKHLAYGMSSKLAQQKRGLETLKTSEGRQNYVPIKYTLKQWVENMDSYLRSAMSYTDSSKMEFFTNHTVAFVFNSPTVQNTINH